MIIRQSTEMDLKLFEPSPEDIAEARAYGIEPAFPPASECVTMCISPLMPLAIGGNEGDQVWFVTSKYVWSLEGKHKREFRKLIMEYRDKMLSQYRVIWNFVWVGNTNHVRFLKSIGAVFHNEFADAGKQFQLFTIGG